MELVDRQFSIIEEILSDLCEGNIDAIQEDYVVFSPLCVITYEPSQCKWFISFDLSIVTDIRLSATFAIIMQLFWEKGVPVYIAEAYHSIFDENGLHIYDLWESEIYDTMNDSKEDYETVKANLIEFYKNQGIKENIH